MKSKRKKLMLIIAGILFVTLILNAIFTWGITFEQNGGFQWSGTYIFENIIKGEQSSTIRLGENTNNPIIGIPFIFWVYGIESPPYVILLDINDETESLEMIFIESVSIEYVDGQKINHNINWGRKFKSSSILRSADAKLNHTPVMQLIDKLPITVDRRQSCNIRFVGYFLNKEGGNISFDTTEYFEYEVSKWRIYPTLGSF